MISPRAPARRTRRDQLLDEAQRTAPRTGGALALTDVEQLAGSLPACDQGVVAALAGIAVGGAPLLVTVDLADEAVDVDDEPPRGRARTRRPGSPQRLTEYAVELAHVPEGERAQERAERRRGHRLVAQNGLRLPGAQEVAVVDRVGARRHRVQKREHLATRPRGPRSLAQVDRLVDQPLDPQPVRQRRRQHQPGVGDEPLVVELRCERVGLGGGPRTVHHMSDLLMSGRGCSIQPLLACSGGHFRADDGRIRISRSVDRG
jgi:hypothetical protein